MRRICFLFSNHKYSLPIKEAFFIITDCDQIWHKDQNLKPTFPIVIQAQSDEALSRCASWISTWTTKIWFWLYFLQTVISSESTPFILFISKPNFIISIESISFYLSTVLNTMWNNGYEKTWQKIQRFDVFSILSWCSWMAVVFQ